MAAKTSLGFMLYIGMIMYYATQKQTRIVFPFANGTLHPFEQYAGSQIVDSVAQYGRT
jgi:hypothetical protein